MRFNAKTAANNIIENLAGGEAYELSAKKQLVSILLTSFVKDKFYETASEEFTRLRALLTQVTPLFAAKVAVYARHKYYLRSITHVVAGELCGRVVGGTMWMKDFLNAVVFRPDDITEITAYYLALKENQKITAQMKKGLGAALSKFDEYSIAKYRAERATVSLVDCVNMFHPSHTEAIGKLVKGELKSVDTWEAKLSEAGKAEGGEEAVADEKAGAWKELIESKKIGYFALLRNLRNIQDQAPEMIPAACELLRDEKLIKRSKVLPLRFATALNIFRMSRSGSREIIDAISDALDICLSNIPPTPGKTLIAVDCSGSMASVAYTVKNRENVAAPIVTASLFGAALYKQSQSDLILFSDNAMYVNFISKQPTMAIANEMISKARMGGTCFHAIFQTAKEKYDRIIILSDMQHWEGDERAAQVSLNAYRKKFNADPHVYTFDVCGYGSAQFPERNLYFMAGLSDKVFDLLGLLEQDKDALINDIEALKFSDYIK